MGSFLRRGAQGDELEPMRPNGWNIPQTAINSGVTPNQEDYHGNYDAQIFEAMFEDLCI